MNFVRKGSIFISFPFRSLLKEMSKERHILFHRKGPGPGRWSYSVYRTLLSESVTKMDQYKRQRIFTVDRLQQDGKVELFELLSKVSSVEEARQIIFKVMDASQCAYSGDDCRIVEKIVNILITSTNREFVWLGAVLMRMYYYLDMHEEAFAAYKDTDSFKGKGCSQVLMDLLYKHGQYSRAVDVFSGLEKFDSHCTTVAFGSLYHINTSESLVKSQSLLTQVATNHIPNRRAVLFAAMHALNQGEADYALEILKSCSPDTTTKNIELVCLCKLQRVKDVLSALDRMEQKTNDITKLWYLRIYSDTWQEISAVIEKVGSPEERVEFQRLENILKCRGVMSHRTIDVFLERVVPGDMDNKKERAKRIIRRTPSRTLS